MTHNTESTNISQNLQLVSDRFNLFLQERNWERYHHPKESSYNLAVEYMELIELFQEDPIDCTGEAILEEIGDVSACFGALANVLSIDKERIEKGYISLETTTSPISLLLQLGARIGNLMENFQWISDEASQTMESHEVAKRSFTEAFYLFLQFANKIGVDPFKAAMHKLDKTSQKYPANKAYTLVNGCLNAKTLKRLERLKSGP